MESLLDEVSSGFARMGGNLDWCPSFIKLYFRYAYADKLLKGDQSMGDGTNWFSIGRKNTNLLKDKKAFCAHRDFPNMPPSAVGLFHSIFTKNNISMQRQLARIRVYAH